METNNKPEKPKRKPEKPKRKPKKPAKEKPKTITFEKGNYLVSF